MCAAGLVAALGLAPRALLLLLVVVIRDHWFLLMLVLMLFAHTHLLSPVQTAADSHLVRVKVKKHRWLTCIR